MKNNRTPIIIAAALALILGTTVAVALIFENNRLKGLPSTISFEVDWGEPEYYRNTGYQVFAPKLYAYTSEEKAVALRTFAPKITVEYATVTQKSVETTDEELVYKRNSILFGTTSTPFEIDTKDNGMTPVRPNISLYATNKITVEYDGQTRTFERPETDSEKNKTTSREQTRTIYNLLNQINYEARYARSRIKTIEEILAEIESSSSSSAAQINGYKNDLAEYNDKISKHVAECKELVESSNDALLKRINCDNIGKTYSLPYEN